MHVTNYINSFVNRPGNIGIRAGYILKYLEGGATCVCRGAQEKEIGVEYREMGVLGHLPRVLNGIRIHLASGFDHKKWDVRIFEFFAQRQIRNIKTDVAHVWEICPELINQLKMAGIPVILDVPIAPSFYSEELARQGKAEFLLGSPYVQKIERDAILSADLIVAPSKFVADILEKMGVDDKRIVVVEFGVDIPLEAASRAVSKKGAKKNGVDFCFVGNINRRKGVPELLSVWTDSVFLEDRLHLCGRINSDVHSHFANIPSQNVLTPGFVNAFDYMLNCDVFVLPSWLEGSAKAVYEAMACGLPAIVTHSTGSIIRDGVDGFLIDAGDVEALKERMVWFKRNPEKIEIMGQNAKERAQRYTWANYSKRLIALYKALCN